MKKSAKTIYEIITERILDELKNGTAPWNKPWKGGNAGSPANLKSKKAYRGVNVIILSMQRRTSRYWLTYNQAKGFGGNVRKGEKGTPVVFWKLIDKKKKADDDDKPAGKYFLLRYYTVFSLDPSGLDMTRDIFDRHDLFLSAAEVNRIALNMDQIEYYNPPPNPAKLSDSRASGYIAEHGSSSWELDALEPRVLRDLIARTVDDYRDDEIYDKRLALEADHKAVLVKVRDNWKEL